MERIGYLDFSIALWYASRIDVSSGGKMVMRDPQLKSQLDLDAVQFEGWC